MNVVGENSVPTCPRPVQSAETVSQGDVSREIYRTGSLITLKDQWKDEKGPKGEICKTIDRKEKEEWPLIGNLQKDEDFSVKVAPN